MGHQGTQGQRSSPAFSQQEKRGRANRSCSWGAVALLPTLPNRTSSKSSPCPWTASRRGLRPDTHLAGGRSGHTGFMRALERMYLPAGSRAGERGAPLSTQGTPPQELSHRKPGSSLWVGLSSRQSLCFRPTTMSVTVKRTIRLLVLVQTKGSLLFSQTALPAAPGPDSAPDSACPLGPSILWSESH